MKGLGMVSVVVVGTSLAMLAGRPAEARSIVRVGHDVVVEAGTRVDDAVAVGGDVTVHGVVEKSAVAVGGSVIVRAGGLVRGDAVAVGGRIQMAEGAEIRGDLVEVSLPGPSALGRWRTWSWGLGIASFAGLLALAVLLVALLPGPVALVSTAVASHPLKGLAWGILSVLAVVPVAVLLGVTVVGIPLIPVEALLVGGAVFVGYVAVAQLVGRKLGAAARRPDLSAVWATVWGLLTLWVIGWIPVLGWLVKAVAGTLGLGGVVQALVSRRRVRA